MHSIHKHFNYFLLGLKVPSVAGATCLPPELGSPDRTVLTIKQEINNQTSIDPVFVDSTTYPGRPTPPLQQHHDDPLDNLENGIRKLSNIMLLSSLFLLLLILVNTSTLFLLYSLLFLYG